MLPIGLTLAGVLARVRKDLSCVPVVSCIGEVHGTPESYGRFMGGSDQNTDNLGQFEQSVHFMQSTQSRINTGDFVYR